jgi:hypothetical protein
MLNVSCLEVWMLNVECWMLNVFYSQAESFNVECFLMWSWKFQCWMFSNVKLKVWLLNVPCLQVASCRTCSIWKLEIQSILTRSLWQCFWFMFVCGLVVWIALWRTRVSNVMELRWFWNPKPSRQQMVACLKLESPNLFPKPSRQQMVACLKLESPNLFHRPTY